MLVCLMSVWSWCLRPTPLCHPWNECLHPPTPIRMKTPGSPVISSPAINQNGPRWNLWKPQWPVTTHVPHLELRWKEVVNEPKVQRILCIVPDLPRCKPCPGCSSIRGLGMGPGEMDGGFKPISEVLRLIHISHQTSVSTKQLRNSSKSFLKITDPIRWCAMVPTMVPHR